MQSFKTQVVISLSLLSLTSMCFANDAYFNTLEKLHEHIPQIGDAYAGGTIYYVDNKQRKGLIVAPCDAPYTANCKGIAGAGYAWDSNPNSFAKTASELFTGETNTAQLNTISTSKVASAIKDYNVAYPANTCESPLTHCSAWYLPSQAELAVLWAVKDSINDAALYDYYWSSTEYSVNGPRDAYFVRFHGGFMGYNFKSSALKIRPVRSFSF